MDVDETYREPLLGQALYHEKALTVTRLFEKLKVQETVALSAVENQKSELHSSSSRLSNQTRRTDPRHTQERSEHSEKDKTTLKSTQQLKTKPKMEYGRVHTRHVNQLFIRGENVLLVNLQQE